MVNACPISLPSQLPLPRSRKESRSRRVVGNLWREHPLPACHRASPPVASHSGVIDGFIALLVGHALLETAGCSGYDSPFLSSLQAGALGGLTIIILSPPLYWALVAVQAITGSSQATPFSGPASSSRLQPQWPSPPPHALGVLVASHYDKSSVPPLDAVHAARVGVLGASVVVTVPLVIVAALFMRETKAMNVLKNAGAPPVYLISPFSSCFPLFLREMEYTRQRCMCVVDVFHLSFVSFHDTCYTWGGRGASVLDPDLSKVHRTSRHLHAAYGC